MTKEMINQVISTIFSDISFERDRSTNGQTDTLIEVLWRTEKDYSLWSLRNKISSNVQRSTNKAIVPQAHCRNFSLKNGLKSFSRAFEWRWFSTDGTLF